MNGIIFQNCINTIIIVALVVLGFYLTNKHITKKIDMIDVKQNQIIMLLSKEYINPPMIKRKPKQEKDN